MAAATKSTGTKSKAKAKKAAKPATFVSKYGNYIIILEAGHIVRNERGIVTMNTPNRQVEFQHNQLRVDDPKLAEELRDHPGFNRHFWELGNAPNEPKPTLQDQLSALATAAGNQDPDGVAAVLRTEKETHKREVVITSCEAALEAMAKDPEVVVGAVQTDPLPPVDED